MHRAKRDLSASMSNQFSGDDQKPRHNVVRTQDYSGYASKQSRSPSHMRAPKRQRVGPPGHSSLIASNIKNSRASLESLSSSPSLRDLRSESWSKDRAASMWDRAPAGYDYLNVRVLKLFNMAHPNTDFHSQNLPAQLRAIKNIKGLRPENSRIFRTLQETDGEVVFPDVIQASRRVAELKGALHRPHLLPDMDFDNFPDEPNEADNTAAGDGKMKITTLVDPQALIVYDAHKTEEIEQRYLASIEKYFPIDEAKGIFAVKFSKIVEPKLTDVNLFTRSEPEEPRIPLIEVLNAFPMAPSGRSTVSHVTMLLRKLCEGFDSGPVQSILVNNGRKVPSRPQWVTIRLEDPARVRDVATKLGTVTLQGRPLITSVGEV